MQNERVAWRPFQRIADALEVGTAGARSPGGRLAVASPWSTNTLSQVVWSDIFGDDDSLPVTRDEAMRVPAVVKGRSLICGTLARQPLTLYRGAERLEPAPWMQRTNSAVSPYARMLWTLDDLIFGGSSLWAVDRDDDGAILDAVRVPPEWWEVTQDLEVLVQGAPAMPDAVLIFEGPQDGLLDLAREDIRAARAMTRAWSSRVKSPVPLVELHHTDDGAPLTDDEVRELIDGWEAARAAGGATGYTPANVEVRVHGDAKTELYVEGRNASRLDFANLLSLPATILEGSTATASLTYSTREDSRNELLDYSLYYWAAAVEARLSMDDVVAAGERVAFDVSWLTQASTPSTSPAQED